MEVCKLCKQPSKLIKAHIVPEAFWPKVSDVGSPKIISNSAGFYPKKSPIGVYDENILCEACDNSLGQLDQHACEKLLKANDQKTLYNRGEIIAHEYPSADAKMLVAFVASVAWRASVSTHNFYGRVDLGPYEPLIASALNNAKELPAHIHVFIGEFEKQTEGFLNPHWTRFEGVRVWVIYAGRFVLYLKLDKRELPDPFDKLRLEHGKPVWTIAREWQTSKEFHLMRKLVLSNQTAFVKAV